MALVRTAGVTHAALEARSRRDLLRLTRELVTQRAPRWRFGGEATIVVRNSELTGDDIRSAFDEIHEKLHVRGILLRVDESGRDSIRAVFEQVPLNMRLSGRRLPGASSPGS